jgi:hypothetical protein
MYEADVTRYPKFRTGLSFYVIGHFQYRANLKVFCVKVVKNEIVNEI